MLNKLDMVPEDEREKRVKDFVKRFKWKGPVFQISALTREGCEPLVQAIWRHVATYQTQIVEPDVRFADLEADDAAEGFVPAADDPRFR